MKCNTGKLIKIKKLKNDKKMQTNEMKWENWDIPNFLVMKWIYSLNETLLCKTYDEIIKKKLNFITFSKNHIYIILELSLHKKDLQKWNSNYL